MGTDEKPVLMALVAYYGPEGTPVRPPRYVPLTVAENCRHVGFVVLSDPALEAELAEWEAFERAKHYTKTEGVWREQRKHA